MTSVGSLLMLVAGHGGGVWWDTPHSQKATASNLGPVITAVELYKRTNNASYAHFASEVFNFWWTYMVNPTTGQVADHMNAPSGEILWWSFTYNQVCGCMLVGMHACVRICVVLSRCVTARAWWCPTRRWSQGLAIGAALALYEVSNDATLLPKAALAAQFLFRSQTVDVAGLSSGPVMFDGASCTDVTCPQFKGIGFRYALSATRRPHQVYRGPRV